MRHQEQGSSGRWGHGGAKRRFGAARWRRGSLAAALALVLCAGIMGTAAATTTSSSDNYSVTETHFGAGSAEDDCSTTYCAKSSVGDTTVGGANSATYGAKFGANTTDVPSLQVIVTGGQQDMGVLDNTTTGTAVDTIAVSSYLSNGYVIQVAGTAPSQGTHSLKSLSTADHCPCTSQQGIEQFGINMVANTTPAIGADPVEQPSGAAAPSNVIDADYSNHNEFLYSDGAIVAQTNVSSGETDYTLSMIINVSNVTPGGRYKGVYSAVVTPMY